MCSSFDDHKLELKRQSSCPIISMIRLEITRLYSFRVFSGEALKPLAIENSMSKVVSHCVSHGVQQFNLKVTAQISLIIS
jgi:hypothetical protein